MDAYGSLHQAVILTNHTHASSAARSVRVVGMTSGSYFRERGCVFDQHPLSPSSQLLNEALEPMDDEETLRMEEEPANNVEEPLNNVALNIYGQEPLLTLNELNSTQSIAEEFIGDFMSPQCEGGHVSHPNSMNLDQYADLGGVSMVSQCETPSAADLERNVNPYADEMSPKTYQEVVQSVKEDIFPPLQARVPMSLPMDGTPSFSEYPSHGSLPVTTPIQSGYISNESQGEQLQLTTSTYANPLPSPMTPLTPGIQKPSTPRTPGIQKPSTPGIQPSTPGTPFSEVEQILSIDGSEVNIVFNSHNSACACRNIYGALSQVVPEVVKPLPIVKKEHMQIKLPDGALPLVTWCSINRSGIIRARIIQELARIITSVHQNKVAKGLCFFGGLTLSESVFVTVEPYTGEPHLHIVPNMMAFWQFASMHSETDPNTPRLGRLQDVRQFVKVLEHTIVKPVKHKEFMVSYALYSACKYCVNEGTEGDKMPTFHQRLGHQLACIQLSQENTTYDVVCYCHEIMRSCLDKLTHWRVVEASTLTNPNTVVYGLFCGNRMVLLNEELASLHLTIDMKQLPVQKVRKMMGNPLLLAIK